MLTPARFRDVCEPYQEAKKPTSLSKWQCIFFAWKIHIIIAKLPVDAENPITYNVCDENLLNAQFGVKLDGAEAIPKESLTETLRKRANNFI